MEPEEIQIQIQMYVHDFCISYLSFDARKKKISEIPCQEFCVPDFVIFVWEPIY